jgi:hypothetical protein
VSHYDFCGTVPTTMASYHIVLICNSTIPPLVHVRQAKESLCFVSQDFAQDLNSTRGVCEPAWRGGGIVREFVLPDYKNVIMPYIRDPSQVGTHAVTTVTTHCSSVVMNFVKQCG